MQVVNHEVERGVTRSDWAFQHQDEMRPAAQFENADLWTLKYRTHANGPHEVSRFLHAVCLQNDVGHAQRWALIVVVHTLGTQGDVAERLPARVYQVSHRVNAILGLLYREQPSL